MPSNCEHLTKNLTSVVQIPELFKEVQPFYLVASFFTEFQQYSEHVLNRIRSHTMTTCCVDFRPVSHKDVRLLYYCPIRYTTKNMFLPKCR